MTRGSHGVRRDALGIRAAETPMVSMIVLPEPNAENSYLADHVRLLRHSLRHWTGRDLLAADREPAEVARRVYDAPFVVLSHSPDSDPILTYGNRAAQALFEATWEELTRMPSRLTA